MILNNLHDSELGKLAMNIAQTGLIGSPDAQLPGAVPGLSIPQGGMHRPGMARHTNQPPPDAMMGGGQSMMQGLGAGGQGLNPKAVLALLNSMKGRRG